MLYNVRNVQVDLSQPASSLVLSQTLGLSHVLAKQTETAARTPIPTQLTSISVHPVGYTSAHIPSQPYISQSANKPLLQSSSSHSSPLIDNNSKYQYDSRVPKSDV